VFSAHCAGPQVVIGSSMGGWIALLLARELRRRGIGNAPAARISGLVLIAPAVDFTEVLMWQRFPAKLKKEIEEKGVWARPSEYGEPYPITRALIEEGRTHLLLGSMIETGCPVRILQGVQDPDVPWNHAVDLTSRLAQDDVVLTLVKDGDHRLSRPEDLERLIKVVGEFYSVYYHSQHGLPTVRARFQNVYGPGEILGGGQWRGTPATVWRNVTPTFVYRALKQLSLTVENGGVATRDFIYVEDIARGLMACALRGAAGDVYNVASGTETSIRELASLINGIVGNPTPPADRPGRDWDRSGRRFGSTAKSKAAIGFEATVPLRAGLERTIAWTREHLDQIEACMARHRDALAAYERSHQNAVA